MIRRQGSAMLRRAPARRLLVHTTPRPQALPLRQQVNGIGRTAEAAAVAEVENRLQLKLRRRTQRTEGTITRSLR